MIHTATITKKRIVTRFLLMKIKLYGSLLIRSRVPFLSL